MRALENKILILSSLLIFVLGIASIVGVGQEKVELTFWHHEAPSHRVRAIQNAIDAFEE